MHVILDVVMWDMQTLNFLDFLQKYTANSDTVTGNTGSKYRTLWNSWNSAAASSRRRRDGLSARSPDDVRQCLLLNVKNIIRNRDCWLQVVVLLRHPASVSFSSDNIGKAANKRLNTRIRIVIFLAFTNVRMPKWSATWENVGEIWTVFCLICLISRLYTTCRDFTCKVRLFMKYPTSTLSTTCISMYYNVRCKKRVYI